MPGVSRMEHDAAEADALRSEREFRHALRGRARSMGEIASG